MSIVRNIWDTPAYTPTAAARLVGLNPARVSRWLLGYEYDYEAAGRSKRRRQEPVVDRAGAAGSKYASFLDLIDLVFVKRFLDHGVPLQRLRRALSEAHAVVGGHHFAQRAFFTDGKDIYLEVARDESTEALLQLLSNGQWVIAPVIRTVAKQIVFDDESGFARRWFPPAGRRRVVVDPEVRFGAPTLIRRGVETAVVLDLYRAERRNARAVADWLGMTESEVQAAVSFEMALAA